jgi:hypothetical protein
VDGRFEEKMDNTVPETKGARAAAWDERIERLLGHAPARLTAAVHWLRDPDRRVVRILAGLLLVLGGIFSILPVLGIWMLPLGLALLAEDWPGIKPRLESAARLCERLWQRFRPKPSTPGQAPRRVADRGRTP